MATTTSGADITGGTGTIPGILSPATTHTIAGTVLLEFRSISGVPGAGRCLVTIVGDTTGMEDTAMGVMGMVDMDMADMPVPGMVDMGTAAIMRTAPHQLAMDTDTVSTTITDLPEALAHITARGVQVRQMLHHAVRWTRWPQTLLHGQV